VSANPSPKNSAPSSSLAEDVLVHAQSGREVIQDFVPLAESLEWELGQQYFRERGSKAFTSDAMPVPFVINNDGTLSRNAAEVFFASLAEADKEGTLEEQIFVLELGIGVGLFARFFLDCFQELCTKHKKNYYHRLCYVAGDRSERMLLDVLRHGVFGNHPGRYCVCNVDAMKPQETLPGDIRLRNAKDKPFRAVFLNYLLDCLPAAVLDLNGEQTKQLCVRTCIARNVKLADYTDWTAKQLHERAKSKNPRARQELLEVYGLFASEYDYRAVDVKKIPHGDFAFEFGRKRSRRLLHNYGAIECLTRLLDLVHDEGFILVNDYGHSKTAKDDDFEHQRFSYATATGVNFPLLEAYFGDSGKCEWLHPSADEERGIHTRLMSRKPAGATFVSFTQKFGKAAFDALEEPITKARGCIQYGRFELAADYYHQALKLQPRNWVLMNEISMFLTYQMRDPKSAIDMAKVALALNPTCSADLWNTLGDALYEFGRTGEARGAYHKAMAINESDVRSRYSLAWVHAREKDYPGALARIAEAIALDKMGHYRDRLLQKQQEVLHHLALRNQQEYLLLINLVSKLAKKDDKKPEDAPPAVPPRLSDEPPETRPPNIL
jgi:tetratricopeptide (TPR) repeat protein